jgi:TolB-like protein
VLLLSTVMALLICCSAPVKKLPLIHFYDLRFSHQAPVKTGAARGDNLELLHFNELRAHNSSLSSLRGCPCVAVFSFSNRTKSHNYDWLSVEFADSIIEKLGITRRADFVDADTVNHIEHRLRGDQSEGGVKRQLAMMGRQTGAEFVVRGSYTLQGGELCVAVEAASTCGGDFIQAPSIKGSIDKVWEIEERAACTVADLIGLKLNDREHSMLCRHPTSCGTAFEEYCKGKQAPEGSYRKVRHLKKATEADSQFVEAHYRLGNAYFAIAMAYRYIEWFNMALGEYRKAAAIEPSNAKAYCAMGLVYMMNGHYDLSRQSLEKALEIDPETKLARSYLLRLENTMSSLTSAPSASLP